MGCGTLKTKKPQAVSPAAFAFFRWKWGSAVHRRTSAVIKIKAIIEGTVDCLDLHQELPCLMFTAPIAYRTVGCKAKNRLLKVSIPPIDICHWPVHIPEFAPCVNMQGQTRGISHKVRTAPRRPCHHRCTWIRRRIWHPCAACWPAGSRTVWHRCSPADGQARWPRR